MVSRPEERTKNEGGWFEFLGRWVVRHPWYPIVFWIVLLIVVVPFLPLLGSVTTNSATTLPANSPSGQASAELDRLFPSDPGGSSSTVLLYGPNLTDANAQRVVLNVTRALENDRSIEYLASVDTVYNQYAEYLAGQAEIVEGILQAALSNATPLPLAINQSADLFWGPPALFLDIWSAMYHGGLCVPVPSVCNYPAYRATAANLSGSTASLLVLNAFYNSSGAGFNGTANCANDTEELQYCVDFTATETEIPLVPVLVPAPAEQAVPTAVLLHLGTGTYTYWPDIQATAAGLLLPTTGVSGVLTIPLWDAFPHGFPDPDTALSWANATVANATLGTEPVTVPSAILARYVAPGGGAQVLELSFSKSDDFAGGSGTPPVYSDLGKIDSLVLGVVASSDPTRSISYLQTGYAPLDLLTQTSVNQSIELVLPLTVGLLLAIAMLYFRSPVTPILTFAGLGIALVLGLGATVLIGTVVGHVDTTAITLEEVFVLGVGTDYSIFLVARYREELVRGRSSEEAIVVAVTWAGQSVATSGSTAIIVTAALAFSGVALLAQWGMVLSLAILITMLLALTLLPACLKIIGPRIFWPTTGARFDRAARASNQRVAQGKTYFYRAAHLSRRHPRWIVGGIVLVSIPLVAVALQVPVSYDFYAQLPSGHEASSGLAELGATFGPGYAVPSFALVTFASPLVVGDQPNATEFTDLAELELLAAGTSGIAAVRSPVGPYGASLPTWLALPSEPVPVRTNLLATLSGYVGTDGRTVLFQLQTNSSGLSYAAVLAVQRVESSFGTYAAGHPEVASVTYGGGAPVINDLASETEVATEVMLIAVTIGLVLALLFVLRSWILALLAVATIGLSISWAWALSDLVLQQLLGSPMFFYVRTILIMLVLGLGIDYNIFLLTRVREERVKGRRTTDATVEAVGRTGGIITAAAIILASAFASLTVGSFILIRAIGFSVAVAVILDAMVVRTYMVPA
ncbi:MAG TPA: MMPL family transporter, partial [Thermoplasmata archaeon]|nr:MMPL family transporter [Thermoplasmata archaeon]